ncbi:hypothetical protein SAMN05216490_2376 [Mucilaginibacter mallensis]|uniref:Uncharacterized protein n=1 Tax=Mucilaginibacter mallensis TaxID=652787 RepID=A0A1H1X6Y1_MUCMA|nr:hypothetical protein SAMN05216490_2376 [Mucilaginibacter mallensis]
MRTLTKSFKAVIYGQADLAELGKFVIVIIILLLIVLYVFGNKFAGV